ncbi:MAG: DMT family transporter [Myxococcota bacterium]
MQTPTLPPPPHPLTARLAVLGAAVLFSTGGAAIKATTLTGLEVAGWRSAIAALSLWLFLPAVRRRFPWRVWPVALAYAATLVLFVASNKLTTAAHTIFLQSTAPFYVVLLAPRWLGERTARRDYLLVLVAGIGLVVLLVGGAPVSVTAPRPTLGNLLALLSGMAWAMTLIGLRWLAREEGSQAHVARQAVVAGNVLAFLLCLPWALNVARATALDWGVLSYLGVAQIGLAYLLLTRGIRYLGALEASLLLLAEPLLNPLWAYLVQHELPGQPALLGGLLVLLATVAKSMDPRVRRA